MASVTSHESGDDTTSARKQMSSFRSNRSLTNLARQAQLRNLRSASESCKSVASSRGKVIEKKSSLSSAAVEQTVSTGRRRMLSSRKRGRNGEIIQGEQEPRKPMMAVTNGMHAMEVEKIHKFSVGPAPFHYEEQALVERDSIDYTIRIPLETAREGKAPRKVRIYADGIYDMFHTGHARQLMQAKVAIPNSYLIVGVCNDELTHKMKGRTVMDEAERYEAIRHCRYVDEVVADAPWTVDEQFLTDHKIDFVAHDDLPYTAGTQDDVYKDVKAKGMFLPTQRTEGISTTDVIARIIKDYDMYVRRNLSRGYTAKELNVSFMKEKKLRMQDTYERFEEKIKDKGKVIMDKWKNSVDKGNELLHKWEDKSREFIGSFLNMFHNDGGISTWLAESKEKIGRAISPTRFEEDCPSPCSSGTASPPLKRGRFSPIDLEDEDEDDDEEEEEEEVEIDEDDFSNAEEKL